MRFSFNEAISFLYKSTNYENFANYKYDRFEQDLREFKSFLKQQNFLNDLPVGIHIAGSKGKGSVAFLLENVLLQSTIDGKSLFPLTFTSPHYRTLMERLRFAGQNFAEEIFALLMHELIPVFEEFRKHGRSMTFFEMMVTLFFKASEYYQPDVLIVETGLGGRLDATNVFNPKIAVITTIEREHTRLLGESIEKIAFEKAGILQKGQIFILAPQIYPEATRVLLEQAEIKKVRKIINLADIEYENTLEYSEIVVNAALEELSGISRFKFPKRIEPVNLTGRQEIKDIEGIELILDSAHTENSMKALSRTLAARKPENSLLILGLNIDKHKASLLHEIPETRHIITCAFESARCLGPLTLAQSLNSMYPERIIEVCPNSEIALHRAINVCKTTGFRRIIVAGSIYLAGEILKLIR